MTVGELLQGVEWVQLPAEPLPAEVSAATDLFAAMAPEAAIQTG